MSDTTQELFQTESTQDNTSISDHIKLKVVDEVFNTNNIDMKTDLNQRQINAITKGKLFATQFNCEIMMNLCNLHETLLISKSRAGRKEFIELTKSFNTTEDLQPSIKERLLG
jgi:hypothetical protein